MPQPRTSSRTRLVRLALFALLGWALVATTGIDERISFVRAGDLGFSVPTVVWVLWAGSII